MDNTTSLNSANQYFTLYTSAKNMVQAWIYSSGFILYILVVITLFKFRNSEILGRPFYKICLSLGISDLAGIFLNHVVDTLKNGFVTDFRLYAKFYFFFNISMWYSGIFHQLLIAMDRFSALVLPIGTEDYVFGGKKIGMWMCACWISALAMTFPQLLDYYQWIYYGGTFFYFNPMNPYAFVYGNIRDWGIQPVVISLTIVIQVATVVRLRIKMNQAQPQQSNPQNRKAEVRLLVQGVLVTIPSVICIICFYINVYVKGMPSWLVQTLNDVVFLFQVIFHTINPVVYLVLSSELRKKFCGLIFGVSSGVSASPAQAAPPAASKGSSRPNTTK